MNLEVTEIGQEVRLLVGKPGTRGVIVGVGHIHGHSMRPACITEHMYSVILVQWLDDDGKELLDAGSAGSVTAVCVDALEVWEEED